MMYDNDNYEITLSSDLDDMLAELPFELIKENILEQIDDPMSTNVNYVDIVVEKCRIYKDTYTDEDIQKTIDDALRDFFTFIIGEIDKRFNLGVDLNELSSNAAIVEIGETIYNYFIIRYAKNISKFISNYIMTYKKDLSAYYMDKGKKDVTTLSYKKQIKDPQDLALISNLYSIIKYIISLDIEPFEFVNLSAGPNNYDAQCIKGLISGEKIVGNFVRDYINLSLDSHDYLIDEIQTDVKIKIIKKLS